jgi:hypothetical protein
MPQNALITRGFYRISPENLNKLSLSDKSTDDRLEGFHEFRGANVPHLPIAQKNDPVSLNR